VECVFVHGSVATGHVDADSDVDLTCVSSEAIPTIEVRRLILDLIGGGWKFDDESLDNPIWSACDSNGIVDDILVTVHYQTRHFVEELIDRVINDGAIRTKEVSFRPYTLIGMLHEALVLHDPEGHFSSWLNRTQTYPERLRRNIVNHFQLSMMEYAHDLVLAARNLSTRMRRSVVVISEHVAVCGAC
jgi:predicted nucleotidyltransferase